jgi:hypothetical protein
VADYIGDPDPRLHSPAPTVPLAAPSVRLLDRSNRDGLQTLTVRVIAPARANIIVLEVGSEVIGAAIDGKPVPDRPLVNSSSASPWSINFWNPPTRGFELRLKIRDTGPVRVTARAGTPGLPSIPGTIYRERPPETMPISGNPASIEQDSSTVVTKSFSFTAR